ncbi:hypothetical protein M433DRAFT_432758 [Acidomyces richmondensis BFW]|nr:MAG: hypothetical protein FE78DRAFT_238019 [Acidomyces sp. 'richmondensis']KYG48274.1 hypothetical protein M433DRAFT_432758 [Acidomyces richmondensis BFW]
MSTLTAPAILPSPFPAPRNRTTGFVNSLLTTIEVLSFTDKLLILISQPPSSGRYIHWVHVPMSTSSPEHAPQDPMMSLLPRTDLTATTLLGGTKREEEVVGQTLATVIASAILAKQPREERALVLGLGVEGFCTLTSLNGESLRDACVATMGERMD